jgi:hypothetical protein
MIIYISFGSTVSGLHWITDVDKLVRGGLRVEETRGSYASLATSVNLLNILRT